MKVGDKVTIWDYSYVCSIRHGKLTHKQSNIFDDKGRQYTVIETECGFPLTLTNRHDLQPKDYHNDTVIQSDDGRMFFIHSRFLKLVDSPHVWKHGDVFRRKSGVILIYLVVNDGPIVYCIRSEYYFDFDCHPASAAPDLKKCLTDATFLFNIKDKLGNS